MHELYKKSTDTLELPAILGRLAECAVCEDAKELCLGLLPSCDRDEAARRLDETEAAVRYMATRSAPRFAGIKNVGASLLRADMGGVLNTRELLDIAGVEAAARSTKAYADGEGRLHTQIDSIFAALRPSKYLEDKITGAIISENEISDTASPELAGIRRHMRIAEERVRSSLQKIITSPAYSKALQEPIITIRGDRFVVPVKAEHRASVPGLVHDVSSSGATLFVEPMQAVNANNELKELTAKEKKEIERILAELSADCADARGDITLNFDLLVQLDFIFAKGKLAYAQDAGRPVISERGAVVLRGARHPLLEKKTAVPITIELGRAFDTLIVTGPNTGGKTVALKTLGLLCLMVQCGLFIPANDGCEVPLFSMILSDIGDEQSIEQSLSTFSSHMVTIVSMLKEMNDNSLLLFDELGAGTDPTEGAALAVAIIQHARAMGAKIAATTHYAELKVFALNTQGVENASCEFDVATLRPTYRLLIGVPGRSNAFAISRRLGLDEAIIERAAGQIGEAQKSFEDVIDRLEEQRQQMEKARREADILKRETAELNEESKKYRAQVEKEREKATAQAKAEARRIIEDARNEADSVFKELNEMRRADIKNADWNEVNRQRAELKHRLNEASDSIGATEEAPAPPPSARPAKEGDTVTLLRAGNIRATVLSVDKDGTLRLQAGIVKTTAKQEDVRLCADEPQPEVKRILADTEVKLRSLGASPRLDLRGMMASEALDELDNFIDTAMMANLTEAVIVHGKGTGALRAAVQQHLKNVKCVKSFRTGKYGEGDNGVTIITFK